VKPVGIGVAGHSLGTDMAPIPTEVLRCEMSRWAQKRAQLSSRGEWSTSVVSLGSKLSHCDCTDPSQSKPIFMTRDPLPALKAWAHNLKKTIGTDGVYLFGSLVYREGQQVVDSTDIDLVVRFPIAAITALDRMRWLEALHVAKRNLEATVSKLLKRDGKKPVCSLVVSTTLEISANVHKDGAHALFSSQPFFDLLTESKTIGIPGAGGNPLLEPLAVQCLRFAQKKRNQYLDLAASGLTAFVAFDGDEPLPKDFMRHAAIASSLSMSSPTPGSEYDVQFGLDFVSGGLYAMRDADKYIEGIHNRLSIRRNARPAKGQVISPQDQIFLAEWIFDKAIEAICLRHYAREPLPERTQSVLMDRISRDLGQHGWRVALLEKGQGCTSPDFNIRLVESRPLIPLVRSSETRWLAYEHHPYDLLMFALAEARRNGDVFNGRKIRLASDFTQDGNAKAAIQETDYFSSLMTDALAWKSVRSKKTSPDGVSPRKVLWDGTSAFLEVTQQGPPRASKDSERL
jgi:predicted nucleotidyltransferase